MIKFPVCVTVIFLKKQLQRRNPDMACILLFVFNKDTAVDEYEEAGDYILNEEAVLNILKSNIQPALGCTEPVALAYAGALAREKTSGEIKSITVLVDNNFYKNCLRVTIPRTTLKGLDYAVALGVIAGKPQYQLEVLKDINEDDIGKAIKMVNASLIEIKIREQFGLYIDVCIKTDSDHGRCLITGNHTNVVCLEHNGNAILCNPCGAGNYKGSALDGLDLAAIIKFIHEIDPKEIEFLSDSWEMNMQIARAGLKEVGVNFFGAALQEIYGDTKAKTSNLHLFNRIKILTSAACDVRMNGLDFPVAAIAGSGNQGITAIVPIGTFAEINKISEENVLRAIALSTLITIYIKSKIGILTPVCGCAIAAGAGASAALAYLQGGSDLDLQAAVINVIGALAGMICDGAKGGCALKLSVAASTAYDAAMLAIRGVVIQPKDGIVGPGAEHTIGNASFLVNKGMQCADKALVQIIESMG